MKETLTDISSDRMVLTVAGKIIRAPTTPPLARKSDPPTSKEAAEKCETFRAKHEALIFDALHFFGKQGGTAKEIATKIQMTDVQVNRRLSAMGKRGLIERNALTDCSGFESRGGCAIWWRRNG